MATYGTFVDGVTLKASELNNFLSRTTYTPVATQGVPLTFSAQSRYYVVNKVVFWNGNFTFSSAGTASNALVFNLPVTASSGSFRAIGFCRFFDDNTTDVKLLTVVKASTTTIQFLSNDGTSLTNRFGVNPAVTIANDDVIAFNIVYEAA